MATKAKTKKTETTAEAEPLRVKSSLNEFEETGCVGFDLAISDGKGLPVGSSILFFALPGCGKSTLISDVLWRLLAKAKAQGLPYRVHYIDSENSLSLLSCIGKDPKNPSIIGLEEFITVYENEDDAFYKPQQLIYHPNIDSFEKVEEVYDNSINKRDEEFNKDIKIIVVDSLTNLTSKALLEAEVSKADFGSDAKERYRFYKKWLNRARHVGITSIFTSQVRQKQGATPYEDPHRPAVTEGDKHFMDVIAKLVKNTNSQRNSLKKIVQKTIDGVIEWQDRFQIRISTFKENNTKSREGRYPDVTILVQHGRRVLNSFTLFNMMEAHGFIKMVNSKTGHFTQEFVDFIKSSEVTTDDLPVKELRIYITNNPQKIREFLKLKGKYTAIVGEIEESDDGFN